MSVLRSFSQLLVGTSTGLTPMLPIPTAVSRVSKKCRTLLHIPNETLRPDNFVLGIRTMLPDSDAG